MKSFQGLVALLILFSFVLSACGKTLPARSDAPISPTTSTSENDELWTPEAKKEFDRCMKESEREGLTKAEYDRAYCECYMHIVPVGCDH